MLGAPGEQNGVQLTARENTRKHVSFRCFARRKLENTRVFEKSGVHLNNSARKHESFRTFVRRCAQRRAKTRVFSSFRSPVRSLERSAKCKNVSVFEASLGCTHVKTQKGACFRALAGLCARARARKTLKNTHLFECLLTRAWSDCSKLTCFLVFLGIHVGSQPRESDKTRVFLTVSGRSGE